MKKNPKWMWWSAGLGLALVLPLTVLPGLSYQVEGPWGAAIHKNSPGDGCNALTIRIPNHSAGYMLLFGERARYGFWGPEGFNQRNGGAYFRFHGFVVFIR